RRLVLIERASQAVTMCIALLSLGIQSPTPSFAATDGTVGINSEGSTDLNLSIPNLVKITGIADLNFGLYSPPGDAEVDDDVCVYTNAPSGNYQVTAHGNGTDDAFTISNGTHVIAYSV